MPGCLNKWRKLLCIKPWLGTQLGIDSILRGEPNVMFTWKRIVAILSKGQFHLILELDRPENEKKPSDFEE